MAPEVISLLSSPEPDALPAKAPPKTTKSLGGLGQRITNPGNNWSFDTLDRIPESSNPGPSAQREEPWWSSDDFDTTGDLRGGKKDNEDLFVDDRPTKRPRLSRSLSPIDLPATSKSVSRATKPVASTSYAASRPVAPQSPARMTRHIPPADVIELSSSPIIPERRFPQATYLDGCLSSDSDNPFRSSPRQAKGPHARKVTGGDISVWDERSTSAAPKSKGPDRAKPSTFLDHELSDSDNPFRSPLPRKSKGQVTANLNIDGLNAWDSDNPFRSSPPKDKGLSIPKGSNQRESEVLSGRHCGFSPKRSTANSTVWDPISSSAPAANGVRSSPPARPLQRSRSDVIALDDSDLGLSSDPDSDDFPDDLSKIKAMKIKRRVNPSFTKSRSEGSKAITSKPRASAAPKKTVAEREQEREQKKLEKELAKEEVKKEKEKAKEQKFREKKEAAALAEVNKIRTDKKISTPEMLVDLPESLPNTTKLQAETLLRDLEVDYTPWASPIPNVVKWRRKVRARYNSSLGHWEPMPMRVEPEKHAMAILVASQFVDLVVASQSPAPETESLPSHVASLKRHFPNHTLIYLLEGLTPWLKRNRTNRDRHFQAAVRSVLPQADSAIPSTTTTTTGRKRKPAAPKAPATYIDEDLIEDALLSLQVHHKCLLHHTSHPVDTARQIATFTQHLSTLPYRRIKDDLNQSAAGFCMDAGQVRTGDGPKDTYVRMLQEITRVTAPIAYGVMGEFETVGKLVRGLEEGGQGRLEDVRRCADKEGTAGDKRIGPAVSKRVWKVFTGKDGGSMDV